MSRIVAFEVPSHSRPDVVHTIELMVGDARCTCEAFRFSGDRKSCRHLEALAQPGKRIQMPVHA